MENIVLIIVIVMMAMIMRNLADMEMMAKAVRVKVPVAKRRNIR